MSKITNNGLIRSGTGFSTAEYPYDNSGRQTVNNDLGKLNYGVKLLRDMSARIETAQCSRMYRAGCRQ